MSENKNHNNENNDNSESHKTDDSDEDYEFYDSENEYFKNCNRIEVPSTLPKCTLCKHCNKDGLACSRIRLGKYTLKRMIAIEKCLEWEELHFKYSTIYYEGSELASYYDNPTEYEAKYIDVQKVKESGYWVAGWVPQCMEELFYAFKYFDLDNRCNKKYEWGEEGLKLFLNNYDIDNKMI